MREFDRACLVLEVPHVSSAHDAVRPAPVAACSR
jgi:hypothetical protein